MKNLATLLGEKVLHAHWHKAGRGLIGLARVTSIRVLACGFLDTAQRLGTTGWR